MSQKHEGDERQQAVSDAARALGALGASKGGNARAQKLTHEERKEIAAKAAAKRWGDRDAPIAVCGSPDRPLRIGRVELEAYVLEDGTRVLSQRQFLEALGKHPKANVRREEAEEQLPAI